MMMTKASATDQPATLTLDALVLYSSTNSAFVLGEGEAAGL
jgi:hypothetical protein